MWQKLASEIKEPVNQEWLGLLQDNLRRCHPHLVASLAMRGDLEAYQQVMVSEAVKYYQESLDSGTDKQTARELAMEMLLRPEEADPETQEEDWELEGATADIVAAAEKQLLSPTAKSQQ